MKLELLRDKAQSMPVPDDAESVTGMCIWHCSYRSLEPLCAFSNLETLVIATYPDSSLAPLALLGKLRHLQIVHLPKISALTPLEGLRQLRSLELSTLPSWDSSRKRTLVASLAPLGSLPALEHVALLGVVPNDGSLRTLESLPRLISGRFMGFPKQEVERFYAATGVENSQVPEPIWSV